MKVHQSDFRFRDEISSRKRPAVPWCASCFLNSSPTARSGNPFTGWIRHHPGEKTDIHLPTSRSALNRVKIKSKPNVICLGLVMSPHGWAELPPLEVGCVSFFMASSQALLTEGAQNSSTRWARGERIFGRFMGPCGPLLGLQWTESTGSSKLEHIHI